MSIEADNLLNKYFPVLDYGFIAMIDYMGGDDSIEKYARVSYGSGTRQSSDKRNLIRYLYRNKHTTPFESTEIAFHMSMPIFIARQVIRHRTACLSGDTELWFDEPAAVKNNKRKSARFTIKDIYNKFHFGSNPGNLGYSISLKDRVQSQYLRCYDENTKLLTHTHILDIWESGIKDVYEIELKNGYKIKMTKDHLCLTNNGWFRLEDAISLKTNNDGIVTAFKTNNLFACNGIPCYQNKEWLLKHKTDGKNITEIANLAGCSYMTIRKWLKKNKISFTVKEKVLLSSKTQTGQKRPNFKAKPIYKEWREAIVKARSGANSNFWKGGITSERQNIGRWTRENAQKVHIKNNFRCIVCNGKEKLVAHHIDPVFNNISLSKDINNLTTLCTPCHVTLHNNNLELIFLQDYKNNNIKQDFFQINNVKLNRPKNKKKPKNVKMTSISYSEIVNIKLIGQEMTYDLSVKGNNKNFIANGMVVHNSVNEYSARYSIMPNLCYTPKKENFTTQSVNNKQGRTDNQLTDESYNDLINKVQNNNQEGFKLYKELLDNDVARELARSHLPLSTYTYWYWKCDLHNLLHFLKLRCDAHAQWEVRQYANIMAGMVKSVAPLAFEAWYDYSYSSVNFTRLDRILVQRYFFNHDLFSLEEYSKEIGMSKREYEEFLVKITLPKEQKFELDISLAKEPSFFEEIVKQNS